MSAVLNAIGAPRPMKMGNIPSPWCYDVVADNATATPQMTMAYDSTLRP